MKFTLLGLTQSILSSMSSDEVNSISDTAESLQVAECIRTSYLNMLSRLNLPEHDELFQLNPSNEDTRPVLMYRPDSINRIEWIKYYDSNPNDSVGLNVSDHDVNTDIIDTTTTSPQVPPGYIPVKFLTIEEFTAMVNGFNTEEDNVSTFILPVTNSGNREPSFYRFNYRTDKQPQYYTVIRNYYIIFDSLDVTQDSTLQADKTQCLGWVTPEFLMHDDFIPNLDEGQFTLLLNEAKSLAFLELKQTIHQKAEKEVNRQLSSLQKFKSLTGKPSGFDSLPSFGRRPGTGGYGFNARFR